MKILVDMDGIVTNTLPAWLERIHYQTGINVHPSDITKWNLHENPGLDLLHPRQIFSILNEEGFTAGLDPMPGALDNINQLVHDGHDVSLVTARYGETCIPETIKWVKANMPWFDVERKLWFCHDKNRITSDMIIDDKAETLVKYEEAHPAAHLITIDYAYNKDAPFDVIRVPNDHQVWNTIKEYIDVLARD